jgi:hypothetical protein
MNAKQNTKSSSSIEQQLNSVQISQRGRAAALHDARIAEMFVGAIEWVGSKLQRSGMEVFAKLSPKY